MTALRANLRPIDKNRHARLMLAWINGDLLAFDVVLEEVMEDPIGVPGVLFALVQFTTRLGGQVAPDFRERLEERLASQQLDVSGPTEPTPG